MFTDTNQIVNEVETPESRSELRRSEASVISANLGDIVARVCAARVQNPPDKAWGVINAILCSQEVIDRARAVGVSIGGIFDMGLTRAATEA